MASARSISRHLEEEEEEEVEDRSAVSLIKLDECK
jgi:hypothetical protein